jgi:exodeoxyribonuclease VII small subunit
LSEGTRVKKSARKKKRSADAEEASDALAELPFEDALARLEGLVDRLEEGDLDLAQALSHFEEGVQLTKHCTAQLEAAERRIETLTREGGDWATRPFAGAETSDASRSDAHSEPGEDFDEENGDA